MALPDIQIDYLLEHIQANFSPSKVTSLIKRLLKSTASN